MLGRTNTGGSGGIGGTELVIVGGTTSPAKANHNTIWIDTDKEITSYVLSATEPENPVEGMVFVPIGDSGRIVATSPVGGNWVTVHPILAKQYISGAWTEKIAKIYQYGEWKDWYLVIVHDGVARVDFSGNVRNTTAMTVTNENGYIKVTSSNSTTNGAATAEKHDVTDYSTIEIDVDIKAIGSYFAVGLHKALNASSAGDAESNMVVKTKTTGTGRQTITVNIEDYSGEYYISTLMYGITSVAILMEYHIYSFKMY